MFQPGTPDSGTLKADAVWESNQCRGCSGGARAAVRGERIQSRKRSGGETGEKPSSPAQLVTHPKVTATSPENQQ